MAKRGAPLEQQTVTAIQMEFLRQWNSGLRGRQLSGQTVLEGLNLNANYRSSPDSLPTSQTVVKVIAKLRAKLEDWDQTGGNNMDRPWSLADLNKHTFNKKYLFALFEIQRTILQGRAILQDPSIPEYRYWQSDQPPTITAREAIWFSRIAEIYPFETSWRERINDQWVEVTLEDPIREDKQGLEFCWLMARSYARREQLAQLLEHEDLFTDLNILMLQGAATHNTNAMEAENFLSMDLGLFPSTVKNDWTTWSKAGVPQTRDQHEEKFEFMGGDNTDSLLSPRGRSNMPEYPYEFRINHTYTTPEGESRGDLLEFVERFEEKKRIQQVTSKTSWHRLMEIEVPNIESSYFIKQGWKSCIIIQDIEGYHYVLSLDLVGIAANQIPPKHHGESKSRIRFKTQDKAAKLLRYVAEIIDHTLTCECEKCSKIRRFMEITEVKPR